MADIDRSKLSRDAGQSTYKPHPDPPPESVSGPIVVQELGMPEPVKEPAARKG